MTEEQRAELPTNDPTNPAHRLARDLADGDFQNEEVAADIYSVLATIARLEAENAAHRELAEAALEVQVRLNCEPTMQGRKWDGVGIRFVNAINASRARLSSRAKGHSQ